MKNALFGALAPFVLGASVAFAQPTPTNLSNSTDDPMKTGANLGSPTPIVSTADDAATKPKARLEAPVIAAPNPVGFLGAPQAVVSGWNNRDACPGTRFWVSTEYLYWRVSSAPIRVPLVTGSSAPGSIGALTEPGTTVLFGQGSGQSTNFGWNSGGRVSVGGWFDPAQKIGFEASGFLMENRSILFNASSPGGTAPIVSIPFNANQPFNSNPFGPVGVFTNPAGPTTFNSGGAANAATVRLDSRLWGAEANGVSTIYSSDRFRVIGLVGFRYLDLYENLSLTDASFDPTIPNGALIVADSFAARNQFYGGQLGAKAEFSFGRWNLDTCLKAALGANHETLNVGGSTTVTNGAFGFASGTTPGGIFAQTTNIGTYERNVFAVVPEVTFKLGYQITPRIEPFVGFNYLFMSNVLRPGNQMDPNTQALFFVPAGTGGAPAPTALHSSSYSAYGVNFGVAVKY